MQHTNSKWKLEKLNAAKVKLNKEIEGKKLPLFVIRGIEDVFNEILSDGSGRTIVTDVKNFFVENKFTIKFEGIGWKITY